MAKRKRPMTKVELEQNLKAMKTGELKHFYKHNMLIKKGDPKPEPFVRPPNKVKARVIYRKRKK